MIVLNSKPLIIGLSHLGQIFSVGWASKYGKCSVFDTNNERLNAFKQGNLAKEERFLISSYKKNKNKISFLKDKKEILSYKNIFITIDTPIDHVGKPDYDYLFEFILNLKPCFPQESNIIIYSQVYPGFSRRLLKDVFVDRKDISLVYMVETLRLGNALHEFKYPKKIIFGIDKNKFPQILNKFSCKKFIFNYETAEIYKAAVNIYLFFSVSFANLIDNFCRENNSSYQDLVAPLRLDKRIGKYSYIQASLGISGGHLERDINSIENNFNNHISKKIIYYLKKNDQNRINLLKKKIKKISLNQTIGNVLWVGASYKKEAFSESNTPLSKYIFRNKNIQQLFVYDSFFNLKKKKYKIIKNLKEFNYKKVLIIFNYASLKDIKIIKRIVAKFNCAIIDISINSALRKIIKDSINIYD